MKIIDKIILNRLITTIINFILAIVKIFSPKTIEDLDIPKPDKRIWKPRWRKNDK